MEPPLLGNHPPVAQLGAGEGKARIAPKGVGDNNVKARPGEPEAGFQAGGWQRPTLPCPRRHSTIGADGLNYRVRDGNGCGPVALVTSQKPLSVVGCQ